MVLFAKNVPFKFKCENQKNYSFIITLGRLKGFQVAGQFKSFDLLSVGVLLVEGSLRKSFLTFFSFQFNFSLFRIIWQLERERVMTCLYYMKRVHLVVLESSVGGCCLSLFSTYKLYEQYGTNTLFNGFW